MDKLLPYGFGLLSVLAVLLWLARGFFGEWVKKAGDRSFNRLFPGKSRVGGRRLLDYRKAVEIDYGEHALGFFRTEPIDIRTVYVPLQYEGGERRADVYERIRAERRSVVVGPAGAGKSLLLKNSILIWAVGPLDRRPHVPVMVDLHRCNTGEDNLVDLVVGELHRHQLHPRKEAVESFVQNALRDGRLRLLFDGLDEVGRDNQDRVVRELRDLAQHYPDCQMVVTCRNAVYHGQLAPEFGHVVEIAEFDDASVRRLLGNWPGIQGAGGPDRLFDMLRKNPPLMRLARSPLLLTMMAYLHVEAFAKTGGTLPNSRAEFYDKAIAHLLGRDVDLGRGKSLSVYHVGEKLAALQRVALTLQEAPPSGTVDRLAMSRRDLVSAVGRTLPELNLDSTHARPLLDEIVDRSQLLVPLDRSNWRYQFRHLTMQEYLTARELAGDPACLMARYRVDPDAWRETVKLWCADGRDCTAVVTEVFAAAEPRHKVLALECLADARRIDPGLADRVIDHFLTRLGWGNRDSEAIIRGFGAVAADSRPRGNKVLDLLTDLARSPDAPGCASAFRALAASGRVEAARVLAPLAPNPDARAALRAMGELAIPVLAEHAGDGTVWAVDDLAVVGTPAAAEKLVRMLWSTEKVATRAAWRLAELLRNPDVEDVLSRTDNTANPAAPSYDWVWRPFASKASDAMPVIAGRIAYLLDKGPADLIPQDTECIDTRIGLPIAALGIKSGPPRYRHYKGLAKQLAKEFVNEQEVMTIGVDYLDVGHAYDKASGNDAPSSSATRLAEELLDRRGVDPRYRRIVELLPWPVRAQLLGRLVAGRGLATRKHWIKVTDTRSSRLLWVYDQLELAALLLGLFGGSGIAIYRLVATITGSWPLGPAWLAWLSLPAAAIALVLYFVLVLYFALKQKEIGYGLLKQKGMGYGVEELIATLSLFLFVYGAFLAMVTIIQWIGWTCLIVVGLIGGMVAMLGDDLRASVNSNVLLRCLNADRQVRLGRRSVIAGSQAS